MRKIVSFTISICLSAVTYSQSVNYQTNNKTNSLAPIKIGASLNFASGLQVAWGVLGQGCLFNKLFYTVNYRRGITRGFSNIGFVGKDELQTTQQEITSDALEIGVSYVIFEKTNKGKMKITTDKNYTRGTYFNYTRETYFYADCDVRKIVTVGGGIFTNNYVYYLKRDTNAYFESSTIKLQPEKDKIFHSNINVFCLYSGVSFKKIKKGVVSAGSYRYRKFKSVSWDFDVLYGFGKANAIQINYYNYSIDNAKVSPLGYRISFKTDRGPTSSIVEIGKLPSIKFSSSHPDLSLFGPEGISTFLNYFRIGFNIILFGNDRRFALKQKSNK